MDLWPTTIDARRGLLATFEQLDGDQWEVPSLSEGWTVREVLAHLILAARPPTRRYAVGLVRARGNFDEVNRRLAVDDARRPVDELLSEYRTVIEHRFSPPGWPDEAPLGDILLHGLDVRIPLGLPTAQPAADYLPVMGLLLSRAGRAFAGTGRPTVRWVATDHDWSQGQGREVTGMLEDLTLTAGGRSARVGQLEGDGVPSIRTWLAA